ncbi:alpha/beta fold hydrolase [Thalassotalea piscium]
MTTSSTFTLADEIESYWQQGTFATFQGIDEIEISYAQFITNPQGQCLVISPGRTEGYIKYQELAYDLAKQGYNIFIIDHRGQGLSQRMASNTHKGYVKNFDDYAHDQATFIQQHVLPHCLPNTKPLVLAHSMGGAITVRVLQLYPDLVKAAVLASPMFAINLGGIPSWLAKGLVNTGVMLNNLFSSEPWYFIGFGDYQEVSFADNLLTQSEQRYQGIINNFQKQPSLQVGGVTFQWLKQAFQVNNDIFNDIHQLKTPILILQAGNDTIVDNATQDEFCTALYQQNKRLCPDRVPFRVDGAYHELFFEQEKYRKQALNTTLNWFQKFQ